MTALERVLYKNKSSFHSVVPMVPAERIWLLDLSVKNPAITDDIAASTHLLGQYIENELSKNDAIYGVGGYLEERNLYKRSTVFDGIAPRNIHLGVDIWAAAGTRIFAPIGGMVHSFTNNAADGDYGGTIILLHQLEGIPFYTLYGHLSVASIATIKEGDYIIRGGIVGYLGNEKENGNWPPHLHFQVIEDIEMKEGDYPGVCAKNHLAFYKQNCPNANLILNMIV